MAKLEYDEGKLSPLVEFMVNNLTLSSRAAKRFYNKSGTAEVRINEGMQGVKMIRGGWHRFRSKEG